MTQLRDERATNLSPARRALAVVSALYEQAAHSLRARCHEGGRLSEARLTEHQQAAHGLAQLAIQLEAARQLLDWAEPSRRWTRRS
ncbi:MAG: hypothetical protein KatS3mg060_1513 [Dehalococcoidia bacterium]|nr:MAG: hypothetical protein KatS3mg060_1513 [Dehalococcoidia bacterium]